MKKLLALIVVLAMALSCVALADITTEGYDTSKDLRVSEEPIELSLLIRGNDAKLHADDFWFFDFVEQFMNVKFNVEAIDSSVFNEKLTILMSTDSMPDMMMASATIWQSNMMTWGQIDQMFLPIDEYAEYCPQYMAEINKQPELIPVVTTPDGHMYGFSNIRVVNEGQSMGIFTVTNVEWLDRLGMEMPTTLDGFYDMLVAFRDQDANGDGDPTNEIPWQTSYNSGYPERIFINWAFGYNGYRWDEVDSTTHIGYFAPYVPRYKEYLEFMKKCWDEGLIQDTFFSGDNDSNTAYGQTHTDYTYYGFSVDVGRNQLTGNPDQWGSYEAQIPVVADDSVTRTTWKGLPLDLFTWTINVDTKYPVECVKFCDTWYDPYMALLYQQGPEYGSEWDLYGNGWVYDHATQQFSYPANTENDSSFRDMKNSIMDGANFGLEGSTAMTYFFDDFKWNNWADNPDSEEYKWQMSLATNNFPYEEFEYFDNIYMSEEDQEIFDTYKTPLQNYMMAQEALFISGERPWEEFDAYMEELDAMGGREFNDFLQTKMAEYFANAVE